MNLLLHLWWKSNLILRLSKSKFLDEMKGKGRFKANLFQYQVHFLYGEWLCRSAKIYSQMQNSTSHEKLMQQGDDSRCKQSCHYGRWHKFSTGPTQWKEKPDPYKLSSDLHIGTVVHACSSATDWEIYKKRKLNLSRERRKFMWNLSH